MLAHIPTFMWAPIWILIPIGIWYPQIRFLGFQCPDQCPVQWSSKIDLWSLKTQCPEICVFPPANQFTVSNAMQKFSVKLVG